MQSEHKIQSGKGSLHIEMDQVPKILKPMVDEWTPGGFIVSFKVSPLFQCPLYTNPHNKNSSKQNKTFSYPKPVRLSSDTATKSSSATTCIDANSRWSSSPKSHFLLSHQGLNKRKKQSSTQRSCPIRSMKLGYASISQKLYTPGSQ